MTTTVQPPAPPAREDRPSPGLDFAWILAVAIALAALIVGIAALVRSGDDSQSGSAGAAPLAVSLTEFAIGNGEISLAEGGSLAVTNNGAAVHNLAVRDTDLTTPDLGNGEQATLDLGSLAPGTYELWCSIAGHAEAGMIADLTVGGSSAVGAGHDGGAEEVDYAALDQAMTDSILAYPAETEGVGNVPLAPTVAADGALEFTITAAITSWEVSPGKFVDAWTYNGTVPGPWIKVNVGDRVRVTVINELPMGTDVHWHGVSTPNDQDGVAPVTQPLIEAGGTYVYEFTAVNETIGMYHAHHHAQMQVPNGMLGVFQIGDMDLPDGRVVSGRQLPEQIDVALELPMVLNDAGVIGYSLNGKSFPATAPVVVDQGDWVLVHYLNEGLQIHPMHQHQFPQLVVAKDGIPLDQPYWSDTVNVAPGERYSVLINATDVGTWVWHCHILTHVEDHDGMFGMVTAMVVQ